MNSFMDKLHAYQDYGKSTDLFNPAPLPFTHENEFDYAQIYTLIDELKETIARGSWSALDEVLPFLFLSLMDVGGENPQNVFRITNKYRQARNIFVALGGIEILKQLFEPPFLPSHDMTYVLSFSLPFCVMNFLFRSLFAFWFSFFFKTGKSRQQSSLSLM